MNYIINGCFDMFHEGHRNFFNYVLSIIDKKRDALCVLINSDQSIKKLKGENRPLNDESNRKMKIESYLSECRLENFTIKTFDTEEELAFAAKLLHAIIVKGSDYTDVSKVTGFGKVPVMIVPTYHQNQTTTTRLIKENEDVS